MYVFDFVMDIGKVDIGICCVLRNRGPARRVGTPKENLGFRI